MKVFIAVVVLACYVFLTKAEEFDFVTLQEHNYNDSTSRIIGGSSASAGQFPWQVAVNYRTSAGSYFCGGSLIGPTWVLTAAHCVRGALSFTLYFGGLTLSSSESGRVTVTTSTYIQHPNYNPNTLNNDIALIRLPSAISYTTRIQPVSLAPASQNVGASVSVTVSGWGRTSDSSTSVSNTLNYVQLTTIANSRCASVYGSSVVISSTLCAVGNPHHSTCSGDSGGPLVIYSNGAATQVGVVSFVHRNGCASGNPSGYVRVSSFRSWISQNTGI